MPSASRWKRRLVRNGSPSPANIRVGSSFSRLNANTPAVNGKLPGTFSFNCQRSDLAVVLEIRQRDLADARAGERGRGERRAQLLVADLHHVFVAGVRGLRLRPHVEQLLRRARRASRRGRRPAHRAPRRPSRTRRRASPSPRAAAGARARCGSARPTSGGSRAPSRRSPRGSARAAPARSTFWPVDCFVAAFGSVPGRELQALAGKRRGERLVERRHAVVVEARGDRPVDRHLVGRRP